MKPMKVRRALSRMRHAKPSLRHYYRLQPHMRWPIPWLEQWKRRSQSNAKDRR